MWSLQLIHNKKWVLNDTESKNRDQYSIIKNINRDWLCHWLINNSLHSLPGNRLGARDSVEKNSEVYK